MNMNDNTPTAEDARIDALLAKRCVAPRAGSAEEILRTVLASGLDEKIDGRLSARVLPARAERTERIWAGVRRVIWRARVTRWGGVAAVAVALLAAIPAFLLQTQQLPPAEQIVSQAVARDQQLADLLALESEGGVEFSGKEIADGINDNSLVWLTILASNES